MAIRRDWIKRQVETLAQALGAALGLKAKGEVQAAVESLESAIKKSFGSDARFLLGLPFEQFLFFACRGETPSAEELAELARVFDEFAALLTAAGRAGEADLARRRAEDCRGAKA